MRGMAEPFFDRLIGRTVAGLTAHAATGGRQSPRSLILDPSRFFCSRLRGARGKSSFGYFLVCLRTLLRACSRKGAERGEASLSPSSAPAARSPRARARCSSNAKTATVR